MKKTAMIMLAISIALVSILLLAVFSLGKTQEALEITPLQLEAFSENPIVTQEETQELDSAVFEKFNFARSGDTTTFKGQVASKQTGQGISGLVSIICDDKEAGVTTSDDEGNFKIEIDWESCGSGDVAYALTEYEGTVYTSKEVTMPNRQFGHQSQSSKSLTSNAAFRTSLSQNEPTNEVPEFSTVTLAGAAIMSLLGILYLRKN